MAGILEGISKRAETKKEVKEPKVYHVVWDRKDKKTGEVNTLSKLYAEALTTAYGEKFDPMALDTGVIKAFTEDLLRAALGKK